MKLVKNNKEFDKLYPYSKSDPTKCKHPKKYPCLVEWVNHDGGLGGDYYSCEVIYIKRKKGFVEEVNAKREILIEYH